jgi:UDP-GlcNAc3NAcA epimerase
MKKIITILGARPQFIKASVVSKKISQSKLLKEKVIHTGQHFDENMSDIFFSELAMSSPDYFLNINGGSHGIMTGLMLTEIERVLLIERPDIVLVYGDTNSTLAGALAAAKLQIPVAHVEAGLRSFNMNMPEEINRILTDRVSKLLFTPNLISADNLRQEGFCDTQIFPVGDVMLDVAIHFGSHVTEKDGIIKEIGLSPKKYILATIHRAENTNDPQKLIAIVQALSQASKIMPVVWPIHPRTRSALDQLNLLSKFGKSLILMNPVGYLNMVQLEKYSALIVTDSGGIQKEAFFYKVPCITLRDETEWTELVDLGWNFLVPPKKSEDIISGIKARIGTSGSPAEPYGHGEASKLIVNSLLKYFL